MNDNLRHITNYNRFCNLINEKVSNDKEQQSKLDELVDKYGEIVGELLYIYGNEIPLTKNDTKAVYQKVYNNPLTLNINNDNKITGRNIERIQQEKRYVLDMNKNINDNKKSDNESIALSNKVSMMTYFRQVSKSDEIRSGTTIGLVDSIFNDSSLCNNIEEDSDDVKLSKSYTPVKINGVIYKVNSVGEKFKEEVGKVALKNSKTFSYLSCNNYLKNNKIKMSLSDILKSTDIDIKNDFVKMVNKNGLSFIYCEYNYKNNSENTTKSNDEKLKKQNHDIYKKNANTGFKDVTLYIIPKEIIIDSLKYKLGLKTDNISHGNVDFSCDKNTLNIKIKTDEIINEDIAILEIIPPFVKADDIKKSLYHDKDEIKENAIKCLNDMEDVDKELIEYSKNHTGLYLLQRIADVLKDINNK